MKNTLKKLSSKFKESEHIFITSHVGLSEYANGNKTEVYGYYYVLPSPKAIRKRLDECVGMINWGENVVINNDIFIYTLFINIENNTATRIGIGDTLCVAIANAAKSFGIGEYLEEMTNLPIGWKNIVYKRPKDFKLWQHGEVAIEDEPPVKFWWKPSVVFDGGNKEKEWNNPAGKWDYSKEKTGEQLVAEINHLINTYKTTKKAIGKIIAEKFDSRKYKTFTIEEIKQLEEMLK